MKGPVSAEVTSTDYDGMMKEAHEFAALRTNIVIKVPLIPEGLKVVKTLTSEGIMLVRNRRHLQLHAVWRLMIASLIAIPLGIAAARGAGIFPPTLQAIHAVANAADS